MPERMEYKFNYAREKYKNRIQWTSKKKRKQIHQAKKNMNTFTDDKHNWIMETECAREVFNGRVLKICNIIVNIEWK